MAINNGDIYRCTFRWVLANQVCNTVWHIRSVLDLSDIQVPGFLQGVATRLIQAMAAVAAAQHESVVYEALSISFAEGNGQPHFHLQDLELVGEQSGEALPGLVALPFFLATGFAGRAFNGRFHWGGLTEALQDDGRLSTAGEGLADALDAVLESLAGINEGSTGWSWVVFSRSQYIAVLQEQGFKPVSGDSLWASRIARKIIGVQHGTILGSMYSRKIGRGQ